MESINRVKFDKLIFLFSSSSSPARTKLAARKQLARAPAESRWRPAMHDARAQPVDESIMLFQEPVVVLPPNATRGRGVVEVRARYYGRLIWGFLFNEWLGCVFCFYYLLLLLLLLFLFIIIFIFIIMVIIA